jgi:hypothetical protein
VLVELKSLNGTQYLDTHRFATLAETQERGEQTPNEFAKQNDASRTHKHPRQGMINPHAIKSVLIFGLIAIEEPLYSS